MLAKKIMLSARLSVIAGTVLVSAACSSRPLTIITSTSPLPANVRGTVPADGVSCQYRLLGILPVTSAPNTQAALQEAKIFADSEVLTDVTIDQTGAFFILFSKHCIHVQGLGVPYAVIDRLSAER